jgi:hypothetical protein
MTITKASGQGSGGKGLLITAITQGTAQTLHTAVAGTAQTQLLGCYVVNNQDHAVMATLVFEPEDASAAVTITETIPARSGLYQFTNQDENVALPVNDTMVVKIFASEASAITAWGRVGDQASAGQKQVIQSGMVTPVRNDLVYRTNGLAESDVERAHQLLIPVAGTLANLRAKAPVTIDGDATVTTEVRVNGAASGMSVDVAAAQTTVIQLSPVSVAVAAGDLVTFKFVCTDHALGGTDRLLASVDFVPAA